jgi:glycogen synthase
LNLSPVNLRILMTTDTVGGVWMYAIELARTLRRHRIQVVLATMGRPPSAEQIRQARAIPDIVLCESTYRLEWMDEPWDDVDRAEHWLLQLADRYRPHLVHLNHYCHGHLEWQVPCVVVAHSCVLSWWEGVLGEPAPGRWDEYRERVTRGLQGADRVVAPSAAMLGTLKRHYGPLPPSTVVHNGRAAANYRPGRKAAYVLAAGRLWDAAKNLEMLTRIAPALHLPLYIAGESRHPDGGEADLGHVHTLGQLSPEALCKWYARAPIYVLPARYEPFGLSVLEAALSGCAPVVGEIDSLRELWGGAACLVPPDDERALIETINRLAADHGERETLAAMARRRALRYSAERMARGYLELYGALLPKAHASAPPLMTSSG